MDFVRPGMYVTWPIGCYASITPELFEEEYAALMAWPVKFLARHRTAVSPEPSYHSHVLLAALQPYKSSCTSRPAGFRQMKEHLFYH